MAHKGFWIGTVAALGAALVSSLVFLAAGAGPAQAAFPGENGRIFYAHSNVVGYDDIPEFPLTDAPDVWAADPDGTDRTNLTSTPELHESAPASSADGTRVAFVRAGSEYGAGDVWAMGADGAGQEKLTDTPRLYERDPAFSPGGGHIAFARYDPETRDTDVWVMRADGTDQRNLTDTPGVDEGEPAFSPDGERIAFSSGGDVWAMGADGTARENLTGPYREDRFGGASSPSWSPDGKSIAFDAGVSKDDCTYGNVFTMDAGGSAWAQLTRNEDHHDCDSSYYSNGSGAPAFSPDGRRIAFVDGAYSESVAVMNRDGSGVRRLDLDARPDDDYSYFAHSPDWGPVPGSSSPEPDETPPDTEITSGPAEGSTVGGAEHGGWAAFSFSAPEEGSSFECRLDDRAFAACASPKRYGPHDGLSGGAHAFEVRAVDAAGNADPSPAKRSFAVDPTADARDEPTVTGPRPKPGARVRDRTPTIRAVVRDATADLGIYSVGLRVDDKWMPHSSYDPETDRLSHTMRRLSFGRHTVLATAADESGNLVKERWSFRVVKRG